MKQLFFILCLGFSHFLSAQLYVWAYKGKIEIHSNNQEKHTPKIYQEISSIKKVILLSTINIKIKFLS